MKGFLRLISFNLTIEISCLSDVVFVGSAEFQKEASWFYLLLNCIPLIHLQFEFNVSNFFLIFQFVSNENLVSFVLPI